MLEKKAKYFFGRGRRKEASATARIYLGGSGILTINGKPATEYLNYPQLFALLEMPLRVVQQQDAYDVTIQVRGGGFRGQADAARLAIAKALLLVDETFRKLLKPHGLLTTDARIKERKKYGLKKARKAKQYTKR